MPENKYSLRFSTKAREDLEQIYIYIFGKLSADIAADRLLKK